MIGEKGYSIFFKSLRIPCLINYRGVRSRVQGQQITGAADPLQCSAWGRVVRAGRGGV